MCPACCLPQELWYLYGQQHIHATLWSVSTLKAHFKHSALVVGQALHLVWIHFETLNK